MDSHVATFRLASLSFNLFTSTVLVNTDEWRSYNHLPETGRIRKALCHTPGQREWARDEEGDGIREVHINTLEGIWTSLRNFLRPFRGVSKWFLNGHVAMFVSVYNFQTICPELIQRMVCPHL